MKSEVVQFEFVITDPVSNPKPGKSLQIRSRCMHGKNKRDGSRRTEREKRKRAKELAEAVVPHPAPAHPIALADDFLPVRFAGRGIDFEAKARLFKAFAHSFLDEEVTPILRCVELDCLESSSFSWIFTDTAYMHSVLSTSYAIDDFRSPQWSGKPSPKTMFHLQEAISMLRVKMKTESVHEDETILRVIMNLALLAAVFGDWSAAAAHFKGLQKIVQLRGNLTFLRQRRTLHFKLDRLDLAWSLSSGRKPHFAQPIESWDCMIADPYSPLPPNLYRPPGDWDHRVLNVFRDFQNLSLMINRNRLRFVINDPSIFQPHLTSLQSRLMTLSSSVARPVEQLVCLIMLAIMTTMFAVPGRRIPYGWVVKQLEKTFIKASGDIMWDKSLLLWVIIVMSFTVADPHHAWIRDAWSTVGTGLQWNDVKTHLLRVIWIEIRHDERGEIAYQHLTNSSRF
ncbi:hypothetical protein E8E13_006272 [Curvularia kusanoi]|uniref:Uncharacterized protein n=1 Tax=Curvularia kusanoi TaxID=90978 RepID=A0A9P4T6K7_CURKU|nr:hypothetical protein E8E13_006272 [Curvularia kusanoi]